MKNPLKGDIKSTCGAYKEWKKGSTSKENYVLEVSKYRHKVKIARNQTELYLENKTKASSKKFFSHRNKKRTRGKKKDLRGRGRWNAIRRKNISVIGFPR